jgi:hypothetical protein
LKSSHSSPGVPENGVMEYFGSTFDDIGFEVPDDFPDSKEEIADLRTTLIMI